MVTGFSRREFLMGAALAALTTVGNAQTPRRIVTLEWAETEIALSLGVTPIGVADLAGYQQWVGISSEKLNDAIDVGGRQQPSLEALMRLKPDLILTSALRHAAIASRLQEIAPTVLLDTGSNQADLYQNMKSSLFSAAKAVDQEKAGQDEWSSFEDHLSSARNRMPKSANVVIAQPLPGVARLRIFTSNSALMKTLAKAGFAEGIDRSAQPFGFTTFGLEDIATFSPDTTLCLLDDALPKELTESAIWPILPMVASGQVHTIGRDIWPFGSTRSMVRLVDRTMHALAF